MIECKSADDYKFLNAITTLHASKLDTIILCSHQHLREFSHKIKPEAQVYFLDNDHWFSSYIHYLKSPIDILFLINAVEQLAYKYELLGKTDISKQLNIIETQLCFVSARLHIHFIEYFKQNNTEYESLGLEEDQKSRYARRLIQEIDSYIDAREEIKDDIKREQFLSQWKRLVHIL